MLLKRIRTPADFTRGGLAIGYEKKGKKERIYLLDDDVHSLILGATRSGKTRGLVLQSIVLQGLAGESMVCSDPKGELHQYCAPLLRMLGYEVIALDFKDPAKSARYNFLQPIIDCAKAGENAKATELAWDMSESLVGESKGEKIWSNGEKAIIAGAMLAVVYDNIQRPEFQNMTNVYFFILEMCRTIDNEMPITAYLRDLKDDHPAKGVFGVAEVAPSRTRGSFFTSALTTLRLFTSENIYSQSCRSDFVLHETGEKKQAIFIILPDGKLTYYSLASLFVYQHYMALTDAADRRGGRLKVRVNYNLDEFGNFTQIPNYSTFLTVAAGRGCRFNAFVQSFSMLDEKYGRETAQTIKDNSHVWIYLKSGNYETAEGISKRLGTYTVSSFSRSSSSSGGTANKSYNTSNSMNLISRPLLTPDEIQRLERPHALVMLSGEYPALMRLPDLSQWYFNELLGLGDEEHNRMVREQREQNRPVRAPSSIRLWGIWNKYNGGDAEEVFDAFEDEFRPPAIAKERLNNL